MDVYLGVRRAVMVEGMTAMMCPGHHGSGLTLGMTGRSAFKMICRPGLEMAHRVSTALASSVLIGVWPPAPSQS